MTGLREKWINIPKLERIYSISSKGYVYNLKEKEIVETRLSPEGFNFVTLYKNDKSKVYRLDRLMVRCFKNFHIDEPGEVIHINGINHDDDLSNLKIVKAIIKQGNIRNEKSRKLSLEQVVKIVQMLKSGYSSRKISESPNLQYRHSCLF